VTCLTAAVLGIEVKLRGTYLTPVQKQVHAKLGRCRIDAVVVRSLDEFVAELEAFGVPLRVRPV
jgi:hypothetical protein